jgi:putative ABC transport system permease protein
MKLRTIGISLVISVAMAMIVAGFYGAEVMRSSMETYFDEARMADLFIEFNEPVNASDIDPELTNSPDVDAYQLRLRKIGTYNYEGEDITTIIMGIEDPGTESINRITLSNGRLFSEKYEAVAIGGMEDYGIKKGKDVQFSIAGNALNLTLTGTVNSPEYIFTSDFAEYSIPISGSLVIIFMNLADLQEFTGEGVGEVAVLLDDDGNEEAVVGSLDQFGIRSVTYKDSHPSVVFMNIGVGKLENMFPLMGTIFMFVGFISIFMTMVRLVQNDSRYIGVLMAQGYTKKDIVGSYLVMGVVIAIIGSIIGAILAILFTYGWVDAALTLYWSMEITFPFAPLPFITGAVYTTLVVLLSVYIPVHFITRLTVREALEYKPRTRVHTSKFSSAKMSRVSMLGMRNTIRNPARMAITVVVVAVTIGAAGSWLIMMDSALGYMINQVEADTWDIRVDFDTPVPSDMADENFIGLEGSDTEYFIQFTYLAGEVRRGGDSFGSPIVGCDEMDRVREFEVKEGKIDLSRAVITNKLADDLGISPGDEITLVIGPAETDLEVSAVVYDAVLYTVYTERSNLVAFIPETFCSGAYIKLTEPGEADVLAKDIRTIPRVSKVVVHSDITETFDYIMNLAGGFLYTFFFLNIIITMVVAGAAVIISTMERDVEFATLDTLGISRGQVIKSIMIEMGFLGIMAGAIGVPFAYLFADMMARGLEDVIFYFPVVLVIGGSILTFVSGFAFVLLASGVPIRYTKKLDTEATIRERTAG